MKPNHLPRLTACILLCLAGCSEEGVMASLDSATVQDISSDTNTAPAVDVVIDSSNPVPEVQSDIGTPDIGTGACEPGDGCFGEACANGDDCLSGICSLHMGEYVCSKTCDAACPSGWSCKLIAGVGDGQYVCVSDFSHLCLPCSTPDGCTGEVPNACVKYPGGLSFCGGACDLETPCPDGFDCQEVTTTTGAVSYQCVNSAGVCNCSALAIDTGLASPCSNESDYGSCSGLRVCTEEGLGACDAPTPITETCNGIDDDCDGNVDEDMCDDGNPCTEDTCLGVDGCSHTPIDGGECIDGDVCTVGDHCENGTCVGTPLECDDNNPCTKDTCDNLGGCSFVNQAAVCDDDDPCTLGDLCQEGSCLGTATLDCDDGNPCTDDACGENGCDHVANDIVCNDDNECSTQSVCTGGTCQAIELTFCDDGETCTDDYCDPTQGCLTSPNNAPCDDGNICSIGDICEGGGCSAGSTLLPCDDGNTCTTDSCDPVSGCLFTANELNCDDNNSCTVDDTCNQGNCTGEGSLNCDDGNPCTTDGCLPEGGCNHIDSVGLCNDADPCTTGDLCQNGSCQPGSAMNCDDNNPCTTDACDDGNCVFSPIDGACDDGNACTQVDECVQGSCSGIKILACDDNNPCTEDSCEPQNGCKHTPIDSPCSDGNACTLGDLCQAGECQGGPAIACIDDNPCTDDGCAPDTGCTFIANEAECNDENQCTVQDACSDGVCQGGASLDCNDGNACTDDGCDAIEGCTHTANEAGCDDSNACTGTDTCSEGNCIGSSPVQCTDNNPCTDDGCDPQVGCSYIPNANECDDGNECSTGDTCTNGSCVPQGLLNCDDGNPCTDDACDPAQGGCVYTPGNCPCGNDCWSPEGCLTSAGRCIRFSCRAGNQSQNFCQNCFGGEWQEISYSQWMNSGYCGDVIDKYRQVEGTNTKCGGASQCCNSSQSCSGGDNAWHFWDGGSNRYTGPCLGCANDVNCTNWDGTDNGTYTRLTVCEKK